MSRTGVQTMVAVVDGDLTRAGRTAKILGQFYQVQTFHDGNGAEEGLARFPCAVAVVDEMAPSAGGPALLRRLRAAPERRGIGLVMVAAGDGPAAESTARDAGADCVLSRLAGSDQLLHSVSTLASRAVEATWGDLPARPRDALRKTVAAFNGLSEHIIVHDGAPDLGMVRDACSHLVQAVHDNDYRAILDGVRDHDNYSYVHSLRVATFLSVFGHAIGLEGDELLTVAIGGLVHDIGKMNIPLAVLNKPGRLEPREWSVMQSHVHRTLAVLHRISHLPKGVLIIAEQHHEKLDGSGYPNGLKEPQLNVLARMASIVDVFGALTDRRVYKAPLSPEAALDLMTNDMAAGLDQNLVARFHLMLLEAGRAA